ncbi:MAG: PD-(D/E)XK nuclease family protein [Clostridia bacterium]|nr:PD-(D/E)XK nuclease family protein [Clostridia bacterium]
MLHLIIGRIGSGKTEKTYELLHSAIAGGGEALVVVPEQYSFETEKNLLLKLGAIEANKAPVYSFTFLAEFLLKKAGISYKPEIDDSTRAMVMSLALEEVGDKLEFYAKTGYSAGFVNELLGMIKEFRQCEVTPEMLAEYNFSEQDIVLKNKVKELALISKAYTAIIEQSYLDNETSLDILHDNFSEIDYFKGKSVFIDGFRGFTAQELVVIEDILRSAKDVYITVCTDKIAGLRNKSGAFYHTKKTASKLFKINDKVLKTPVDVIKTEYDSYYKNDELRRLENNFYSFTPEKSEVEPENITICSAETFYAECDYVAFNIKKLISENGYRCRDIAVISRDSTAYERQIKAALKKYGVPVYIDKRQPVMNQPVMSLVFAALKIAEFGFENESVFRILKTGLTGISEENIAVLENYTSVWQVRGNSWCNDFTGNPAGFGKELSEKDAEKLSKINEIRKSVAMPVAKFRKAMKETDGKGAALAVYNLLMVFHVDINLREFAKLLIANNEIDLAEDQNRVWEILMQILDGIAAAVDKRKVTPKRFNELFRVMVSGYTMGSLPKGLDEVTVGSADRVRVTSPKAVFVVGVSEGTFPFIQKNQKILSRSEREKLRSFGIDLSQTAEEEVMEERFISYNAFCCAAERLYVSYPRKSVSGGDCTSSELVEQIKRIFPKVKTLDTVEIPVQEYIRSGDSAFQKYAETYDSDSDISIALKEYFNKNNDYKGKVSALKRATKKEPFKIEDESVARKLFKENMYISPSRADVFYSCPFKYYCKHGLKADPLTVAELDPMAKGNIVHYVLENLIKNNGSKALSEMDENEVKRLVEELLEQYFNEKIAPQGETSERTRFSFNNIRKKIFLAVKRLIEEFKVCDFVPVDFELTIDNDSIVQPIEIQLKNGTIKLTGKVDRVDMLKTDDKNFVRIIDYKSSVKEFSLANVFAGLNMQMLIYLFSIWKNGTEQYENSTPAGVLYMPVANSVASLNRNATEEDVLNHHLKENKMNGIILNDSRVIEGMDNTLSGAIIPVSYTKDNTFKGKLIDFGLLQNLYEKVEDNLKNMGNSLHDGKIQAVPIDKACDNCDYRSICGFENGDEIREIDKLKDEECIDILKGGEDNA